MSTWSQVLITFAVTILIGALIGLIARQVPQSFAARYARVSRTMPWYFFAASAVFFLALAVNSSAPLPYATFSWAFVALQVMCAVRAAWRDRLRFGLQHLLLFMTCCAVWAGMFRVIGSDLLTLSGIVSVVAMLLLFAVQWLKMRANKELLAAK